MTKTKTTTPRQATAMAGALLACACLHRGAAFAPSHMAASSRRPVGRLPRSRPPLPSGPPAIATLGPRLGAAPPSSADGPPPPSSPPPSSPRSRIRGLTGFSLTALRATLRAATGISLSGALSTALRRCLGLFRPDLRYFLQPLLILYYAPLLLVRYYVVGPSRAYVEESRRGHERAVEGWRRAVEAAEGAQAGGYWPVTVNDDGTITTSLPPDPDEVLDLAAGIERSVVAASAAEAPTAA